MCYFLLLRIVLISEDFLVTEGFEFPLLLGLENVSVMT